MTTLEFIKRARNVHGPNYLYDLVDYKNTHTEVPIICPIHGIFEQKPHNHIQGGGCPWCADNSRKQHSCLTRLNNSGSFIEKARIIHGDKYDYSKFIYIDAKTKGEIICKEHGSYWQAPKDHLLGHGCPTCNNSFLELAVRNLLSDKLDFQQETSFEWLVNQRNLRLDFYLPHFNVAIECQGEQHFKPVKRFGGKDSFIVGCENDDIKHQLCKEHGIEILYFADAEDYIKDYRYPVITDIDELLKEILKRGDSDGTVSK